MSLQEMENAVKISKGIWNFTTSFFSRTHWRRGFLHCHWVGTLLWRFPKPNVCCSSFTQRHSWPMHEVCLLLWQKTLVFFSFKRPVSFGNLSFSFCFLNSEDLRDQCCYAASVDVSHSTVFEMSRTAFEQKDDFFLPKSFQWPAKSQKGSGYERRIERGISRGQVYWTVEMISSLCVQLVLKASELCNAVIAFIERGTLGETTRD